MQSQPDDAQAIAQLVQDIEASLAHLRRAQGWANHGRDDRGEWRDYQVEIAPHVSRRWVLITRVIKSDILTIENLCYN